MRWLIDFLTEGGVTDEWAPILAKWIATLGVLCVSVVVNYIAKNLIRQLCRGCEGIIEAGHARACEGILETGPVPPLHNHLWVGWVPHPQRIVYRKKMSMLCFSITNKPVGAVDACRFPGSLACGFYF